jgi:hypothetical protein
MRVMTARELIERLEEIEPEAEVVLWDGRHQEFTRKFLVHQSLLGDEVLVAPSTAEHDVLRIVPRVIG